MALKKLKKSLIEAPIIKKKDYFYVVHPITDGVPEINPDLLNEVIDELQKRIEKIRGIDKIVTIEAMGIPLAATLSLRTKKPFLIIRKREYGLPNEHVVKQQTGYSKSKLYINGLKKGDKIVIVDDVLSTGGTLKAIIKNLKSIGVLIQGIFIVVDKGNNAKKIRETYKIDIDILVNIEIVNGKVKIRENIS